MQVCKYPLLLAYGPDIKKGARVKKGKGGIERAREVKEREGITSILRSE